MASPLTTVRNNFINNPKRQNIETPDIVCKFIASLFPKVKRVLDPCSGTGNLLRPFAKRHCNIIWFEVEGGRDFLQYNDKIEVDLVLCNPPFNLGVGRKLGSEIFLQKIIDICGNKTPIVLFVPMGFRLNQRKNSSRWRWLRDTVEISSILSLPLDIFDNVTFHSEVLFFNTDGLKPHYFLPNEFLD